ncbi:MAG: hypothetical protein GY838_10455 [bacterium]|nr:hypothetical protein [bacterium]
MRAVPYESDRSAARVDRSLRRSLAVLDEAHLYSVLWFGGVIRRRLFREFGYSSIHKYATDHGEREPGSGGCEVHWPRRSLIS